MDISDLIKLHSSSLGKLRPKFLKTKVIENVFLKKKTMYLESRDKVISFFLFLICFVSIFVYIYKLYDLQILNYEKFIKLSNQNYIRSEIIYPNRGLILDRNRNLLVKNVPTYVLNQNTSKCIVLKNRDYSNCFKQVEKVKTIIELDLSNVKDRYGKESIILLKRNLSKDEVILLGSLRNIESIEVAALPSREYSSSYSMSHLLGYIGKSSSKIGEYEGKMGVENYYEEFLAGSSGSNLFKSDSYNTKLDSYLQISPISGKDVVLAIDAELQNYSYELLKNKIESMSSAVGGVIIAQDPRNGDVLALVNYPSFDINKMTIGLSEIEYQKLLTDKNFPFLNRAISGVYPPGSVYKVVTASGILQEGIAKPDDTIFDPGFVKVGESIYGNWKRDGHGEVDYIKSMKVSNDTYYYIFSGGYKIDKGLGISGIYNWSKKYKLGELTGIDLPGEVPGFIPDGKYKTWYLGDTFISAIGQGDTLTTPIQMSVLMGYFANNQIAYSPRVVLEADKLIKKEKVLYDKLLNDDIFDLIKLSLKEVNMPGGTGYPFFDFNQKHGFESAGKTGTSEYYDSRYKDILTHAWYSGWAPYENGEIVVTVFLESGGGGADDAAPLARKVMDFYFENKK